MYEVETSLDRRTDPAIKHYLREIGKYPLLRREQEEELARRIRGGDKEALDALVNANLRFVVSVAKKFLNRGLGFMDLIAEGNVGLITAARRFDETRGVRFVTYAAWWIKQFIQVALQDQVRPVRLPANQARLIPALIQAEQNLEQTKGGLVGPEDLAGELGIPLRRLRNIQGAVGAPVRLDAHDDSTGDSPVGALEDENWRSPLDSIAAERLERALEGALAQLDDRDQEIVSCHYGLGDGQGMSLEAIGKGRSLSRERIRQLRNRALDRLRGSMRYRDLADSLS
ncbi:MAG: RNA polymerase sigma factor RpoD/SigA [Candidatus Krumholzibacteriia bacterium]